MKSLARRMQCHLNVVLTFTDPDDKVKLGMLSRREHKSMTEYVLKLVLTDIRLAENQGIIKKYL